MAMSEDHVEHRIVEGRLSKADCRRTMKFKRSTGEVWSMYVVNGRWYMNVDGVVAEINNPEYMNARWLWTADRDWVNLDDDNHIELNRTRESWEYLATVLCPMYEAWYHTDTCSSIKMWSHGGATRQYGDVGNNVMYIVMKVAHRLRRCMNLEELYYINRQLAKEKASDLLEATMGRGVLEPDEWTVPRDHVDKVCCVMYELWSEPEWSQVWDLEVLVDEVLRRYFYDAWAYNTQDSVRRQRQAYATSGIFGFFRAAPVVQTIKSFL